MAELSKYSSFVLTYNSTSATFEVGSLAYAVVYPEGAYASQTKSLTGTVDETLTVYDKGSITADKWIKIGVNGTPKRVKTAAATQLTFYGDGISQSVTLGDRILNLGSNGNYVSSDAVIYPVDQSTGTAATYSRVRCDDNGNYSFYAAAGDYDVLILDSTLATCLYIDPDITLLPIGQSSSGGFSSRALTYPLSGDLGLASTYATSPVYLGTVSGSGDAGTRGRIDIGLTDTANPGIRLDGETGIEIRSTSTAPTLKFKYGTNYAASLVPASLSGNRTITIPDSGAASSSFVLTEGNQTVAGVKTFTGGLTVSTTAATFSAALQSSESAYFAKGLVVGTTDNPTADKGISGIKLYLNKDTALSATDFAITGWGSTATKTVTDASTASRFKLTIATGGTSFANPATVTLTFPVAFVTTPYTPFALVTMNSDDATIHAGAMTWTVSTTQLVISVAALPTTGKNVYFNAIILG